MWCSESSFQSGMQVRLSVSLTRFRARSTRALLDWIRAGITFFNSRHVCYPIVRVWRPWTNHAPSLQATLDFWPPKQCAVHGEVTLSLCASSGWTISDAVLPTSVHRVCQTASVGAQLQRWQEKNPVSSVCFPETETFWETPLARRGTLMSQGGCWTYSKVTKLFSYQLSTSKSKGRGYTLMLRECKSQAPGLWLISTLRCVSRGNGKGEGPGLCAQLV